MTDFVSLDLSGFGLTSTAAQNSGSLSISGFSVTSFEPTDFVVLPISAFTVDSVVVVEDTGIVFLGPFTVSSAGSTGGFALSTDLSIMGFSVSAEADIESNASIDISITIDSLSLSGGVASVDINISAFSVVSYEPGFGSASISGFSVSGISLAGGIGKVDLALSGFSTTGVSVAQSLDYAAADIGQLFSVSSVVLSENISSGNVGIKGFGLDAQSLTGTVGSVGFSFTFTVNSLGYGDNPQSVSIDISAGMGVDAFGVEALSQTYSVIAMNSELGGDSITEFESFEFNSFAAFDGKYFAAGPNGVYELTSLSDDGSFIEARVLMGVTDFGAETQTHVPYIYLTYRTDGDLDIVTRTNENIERVNPAEWNGTQGIHEKRARLDPGVISHDWQFGFQNVSGSDFEVSALRPLPFPTDRRIK